MDPRTEPHSPEHGDDVARPATPLSLDARAPRPAKLLVLSNGHNHNHSHNAIQASVDLASVMTAASNPVSPGPSGPPHTQNHTHDFVPPTRPSSTPFPQPELRADDVRCLGYSDGVPAGAGACGGHDEPEEEMIIETLEGDYPGSIAVSQMTSPMDVMDLDVLQGQEGSGRMDYGDLASSSIAADPQDLSGVMDIVAVPTTPSLSPISTVATSLDSPDSHFDSLLEFPLDDLGAKDGQPETETSLPPKPKQQTLFLQNLPMEIQELILDHVFDCRVSPMTKSWPDKRLTKMATFTRVWRTLIQQRLYCRIKLKATAWTMYNTLRHFHKHPHLESYVKHVELWFPVFQPKATPPALSPVSTTPTITLDGVSNASYSLPGDNCSLEEAFLVLSLTFSELSVLTLEGGERKKAPQIRHFAFEDEILDDRYIRLWARPGAEAASVQLIDPSDPSAIARRRILATIPTVRTLVCKGQWNIMRTDNDFKNIANALPNLHEWQGLYSKPKSKSYLSMAMILPKIPTNLTSLDLCLEGDYRQEISFPRYFLKVLNRVHFCANLAEATPALQHLSYTGRVCRTFFDVAARLADPRTTRLKSVDVTVKNCCRHVTHWHESGSGVTDLNFIRAFESLVLSAVRSLAKLKALEHLRIRYVDLDFPIPPLNPFFLIHNGRASGVWSDTIVAELNRVRPDVSWEELSDSIGERTLSKDGRLIINAEFPKKRVVSLKLSNYAYLVAQATTM
ncbi:hypothetical protein SCUCBS95973_001407 [Sporothrix curviconia]|uniref:F-box domain-containing protein n=1 Tax=Sporothrix curviconia TaxID=1260050 RepID=A0ABP0AYW4_9PEZI